VHLRLFPMINDLMSRALQGCTVCVAKYVPRKDICMYVYIYIVILYSVCVYIV